MFISVFALQALIFIIHYQKNTMKSIICAIMLSTPLLLYSQDLAGTYTTKFTLDDGQKVEMTIEIMENGNYSVDNNGDGQMDVFAKYILEEDQVTIWSVSGDDCRDKGTYEIDITDNAFTVRVKDDPCQGRIPPNGEATWKKKKS